LDEHKSPEKPTQKLTHWSSRRQVLAISLEPPASEPRAAVYRRNGGLAEQALPTDIPMQWRDCAGCSGASVVKIQHGGL